MTVLGLVERWFIIGIPYITLLTLPIFVLLVVMIVVLLLLFPRWRERMDLVLLLPFYVTNLNANL